MEKWAKTWSGEESSKKGLDRKMLEDWRAKWLATIPDGRRENDGGPDTKVLRLHQGLQKAESSILIQARTEKTDLAQFTRSRKVPEVVTSICRCGSGPETAQHVVLHCSLENERQGLLRRGDAGGTLDYRWLTNTNQGAKRMSKWLIQSGRLPQFSLASTLLYG
jgi:hypothetical protein